MSILGNFLWRPRGVYRSIGEWAVERGGFACLKPLPAGLLDDAAAADRWHLAELPRGKVIGDARLVATADNDVPGQLQALHGDAHPASHWALRQARFRWPRRLYGKAVILASAAGGNYYHWLFDGLPRLHLLKAAGLGWENIDWFLLNEARHRFDIKSMEMLGIPVSRLVRCSKRRVTVADKLIVPPMPSTPPGQIPPWVCEFLRQSFLPAHLVSQPGRRLYLSRRHTSKRRLGNEAAVEQLFRQRGFEVVHPEQLSFRDQVALFAGAAAVVGPHGAAFANLVFAPLDVRVIELFHPKHQEPCYEKIARSLGMTYHRMVGEAPGERAADRSEKLGPYSVAPDELIRLLDSQGL